MHLKVFTKCQMLCNAYDDMSGFSILNTRGVTIQHQKATVPPIGIIRGWLGVLPMLPLVGVFRQEPLHEVAVLV